MTHCPQVIRVIDSATTPSSEEKMKVCWHQNPERATPLSLSLACFHLRLFFRSFPLPKANKKFVDSPSSKGRCFEGKKKSSNLCRPQGLFEMKPCDFIPTFHSGCFTRDMLWFHVKLPSITRRGKSVLLWDMYCGMRALQPSGCTTERCKFVRAKLRESFCPAAASHSRPRQAGA